MDLTLAEQLHNLGIQMYHAAAAGSIHVPYLKTLHKRMSSPLVGDTVTFVGRSGHTPYESTQTGVLLLSADSKDHAGPGPRMGMVAPLERPELMVGSRYDSLIALPVVSNEPGANDGWASVPNPVPVHLLRCEDEAGAEQVRGELERTDIPAKLYGRNLLFAAAGISAVVRVARYATTNGFTTQDQADRMVARMEAGQA